MFSNVIGINPSLFRPTLHNVTLIKTEPISDYKKQQICKTEEETRDLIYKLPETMFLKEMFILRSL